MRPTIPAFLALISITAPAYSAPTAFQLCESALRLASGKYAQCRLIAASKYSKTLDSEKSNEAAIACTTSLDRAFAKATEKYGAACTAIDTSSDFASYLNQCLDDAALAASGYPLPDYVADLATCTANLVTVQDDLATTSASLATCESELAVSAACGNGTVDADEACDGSDLNAATCATQGFAGGTLRCASGCTLDTSACYATRFVDNADGTVTDNQTSLVWEKKTTAVGSGENLTDPHDVDNKYTWTVSALISPYPPNGTAFTDFLARLNGSIDGVCFTGKCDWRLPTYDELLSILDCGAGAPCIPGAFGATVSDLYWSSTTYAFSPLSNRRFARLVSFATGAPFNLLKDDVFFVRAVRGG